jgi:peptide/nickel transport system substrate-binding protein
MKSNIIKYVFIIIVIGLVGYAGYLLYGQNETKTNNVAEETQTTEENQTITNIRMPIVSFDTINPILSNNQNVQDISRLIYEPLLNVTSDNKIELCLANEWSKQSSTSYVIKLKENVKWQDGNILTAKDVQFTIDRLKELGAISIYAYNVEKVIGVEVIDNSTIRINLSEEVPFFEYNLTFPIMSYQYYLNEDFTNTDKNNHPVGTGRFKVISNDDEKITLKINQNWWNSDKEETKLEQIEIIKYTTMGEVYNAFKIGSIDLFTTKTNKLEDYIGTIGYNKKEYYGRSLDYLCFNCEDAVLANVEVRKTISYLIDKSNIVEGIYNGGGYVSNFPLTDENYLYKDSKVNYELNQETATNILTEAGWSYSKKIWQRTQNYRTQKLRFDIVVNSSNESRVSVAENIKQTLSDFGIDITIKKVSDSQYQNYLKNKNYDMILTGVYCGLSPDLSYYFSNDNLANFENDELTSLLDEVKNIQDEKILKEKYNRIIEIYQEQMPYVFLYNSKNTLVYSQNLYGEFNSNSYNVYDGIGTWYRQ